MLDTTEPTTEAPTDPPPEPAIEPAAERPPQETAHETVLIRQVRYFVAICSMAAGVLHFLAMTAHADHHPTLGRAFFMVAVLQVVFGVLLLVQPSRLVVMLGLLGTIGVIVMWMFTRTKGISWFPGLHEVDPLEWRDVVTQFFQLLVVAGALLLLLPARVHEPAGDRVELAPVALMIVLSTLTLGVLYAATYDYVHGGAEQSETGGDGHAH